MTESPHAGTAVQTSIVQPVGLCAVLLGFVVLIGWIFQIEFLTRLSPEFGTMKINTAICFILLGISLLLFGIGGSHGKVWVSSQLLAGMTAAIGLATLVEYATGRDLYIDEFLLRARSAGELFPGRMAPATAFAFLFLGVSLFVLHTQNRSLRIAGEYAAVMAILIGFTAALGYLYGIPPLYGITRHTTVALHTAAAITAIGLAMTLARRDGLVAGLVLDRSVAGMLIRWLVPVVTIVPISLGLFIVLGERTGFQDVNLRLALSVIAFVFLATLTLLAVSRSLQQFERETSKPRLRSAAIEGPLEAESRNSRLPKSTWALLTATAIAGAVGSVGAHYLCGYFDGRQVKNALELRVEWRAKDLQSKAEQLAEAPNSMAAFVNFSELNFTADEFQRFAVQVKTLQPMIRTLAWAPYVKAGNRAEFERVASKAVGADFRIQERTPAGIIEASARDDYLPILFVSSYIPDLVVPVGIDLLSQHANRATILRARDEDRASATSPSVSRVSATPEVVINIFVPVYSRLAPSSDVDQRRAAWRGVVVASLSIPEFLTEAIRGIPRLPSFFYVGIGTASGEGIGRDSIMHVSTPLATVFKQIDALPDSSAHDAHRFARKFDALGQTWVLTFDYPAAIARDLGSAYRWAWPLFVLALAALILYAIYLEGSQTAHAERMVAARTEELTALLNSIPAYVWIATDRECGRVIGNRAANELLHATSTTNVSYSTEARNIAVPVKLFKEDGGEYRTEELPLRKAVALNQPISGAFIDFRFADGRRIEALGSAAPLFDANGRTRGGLAAFVDITDRRKAETELRESMARLSMLSERIVSIQEAERNALAQELHDQIGQTLTAVKLHLQALAHTGDTTGSPASNAHLDEALLAVTQALVQVRGMSLDLRPLQLNDLGLAAALRGHAERQAALGGWQLHFEENVAPQRFAPELEIACFRVAQEALTNVLRHAGADQVWIALQHNGQNLRLTVRDNGRGFEIGATSAADKRSLGLIGMSERAETAGGRFEIASSPGAGTGISAVFPIAADTTLAAGEERRK